MVEDILRIKFLDKLLKAKILRRLSRFTFEIEINGSTEIAHCPATGKIANRSIKNFEAMDCLVSPANNLARKTQWTVEAIKVNDSWFGINQNKSNRYVEEFLKSEQAVDLLLQSNNELKREFKLDESRIDFRVDSTLLEVKTMLAEYYGTYDNPIVGNSERPSVTRMSKHVHTLANNITNGNFSRAILLSVFQYDAPPFRPPSNVEEYSDFVEELKAAKAAGLENWQLNLEIDEAGVSIKRVFRNEHL